MTTNCVAAFTNLAESVAPQLRATIKLRGRPNAGADAVVYLRSPDNASHAEDYDRLLATLNEVEWIARIDPRRTTLDLTFTDDFVDRWTQALTRGELPAIGPSQSMIGKRFAVQYLDPNLTKALHAGHLWNISLGEAFASMLEAAGAHVTRRLWYADAGRSMFEAIAGVIKACAGQPNLAPDVKFDHFVGHCYANYVGHMQAGEQDANISPIDRELSGFGDMAEDLTRRWLEGDDTVHNYWRRVRDGVDAGQQVTLNRIGIRMDETLYQSDCLRDLDKLIYDGLSKGLLDRRDDGTIVYYSDRKGFDRLTLVRADGFSTEYARLIAMIWRDQPLATNYDAVVAVSGDEWHPSGALFEEFLKRLGPCPLYDKVTLIYHSMLTVRGAKMKSRDGRAILIDDLLDRLIDEPRLRKLAQQHNAESSAELLANIIIRIFFLTHHPRKSVEFSWDRILDEQRNPGWLVCRAFCLMRSPNGAAKIGEGESDSLRRLIVARTHELPSILLRSIERGDPRTLTKFLIQICNLCVDPPQKAELVCMGRILVETLLTALGLPVQTDEPFRSS
jgi:arginyl-tRNA synthetase